LRGYRAGKRELPECAFPSYSLGTRLIFPLVPKLQLGNAVLEAPASTPSVYSIPLEDQRLLQPSL